MVEIKNAPTYQAGRFHLRLSLLGFIQLRQTSIDSFSAALEKIQSGCEYRCESDAAVNNANH